MCAVEESPYTCRFDTTTLATASTASGPSPQTTPATPPPPPPPLFGPWTTRWARSPWRIRGAYLTGTVALQAAANSTAGITNVRLQTAPAGTTTWTPPSRHDRHPAAHLHLNSTAVADGLYDVRAILLESTGKGTISATVSGRRVDNSPLRAADIQATNGGGLLGRVDAGDIISFSYSQQVNLATVTPGWNGAALPVTVRLRDGNLLGQGNALLTPWTSSGPAAP